VSETRKVETMQIIDVNTWLGSWPFEYVREDTAACLDELLALEDVSLAYVSTPEAALNADSVEANRRLLEQVKPYPRLRPVPTVDPTVVGWREVLAEYGDDGVAAIKVLPGYHGYRCSSDEAAAVAAELAARDMALIVQVRISDERTHHPLCQVPAVPMGDIVELAKQNPQLPIVAASVYYREAVEVARAAPNVSFDISHVEKMRTIPSLLDEVPAERVLFGSHAPLLTLRSAKMKLTAPGVSEADRERIACGNAEGIFRTAT